MRSSIQGNLAERPAEALTSLALRGEEKRNRKNKWVLEEAALTYSHTLHLFGAFLRHRHVLLRVTESVYKLVEAIGDVRL